MAKARVVKQTHDDALRRDLFAVGLLVVAGLCLISLIYRGEALIPAKLGLALRLSLGLGAWFIPVIFLYIAGTLALNRVPEIPMRLYIGIGMLLLALQTILQIRVTPELADLFSQHDSLITGGGYVGAGFAWVLLRLFGLAATWVIIIGMILVGLVLLTRATAQDVLETMGIHLRNGTEKAAGGIRRVKDRNASSTTRQPRRMEGRAVRSLPVPDVDLHEDIPDEIEREPDTEPVAAKRRKGRKALAEEGGSLPASKLAPEFDDSLPVPPVLTPRSALYDDANEETVTLKPIGSSSDTDDDDLPVAPTERARPRRRQADVFTAQPVQQRLLRNKDMFILPGVELLTAFRDQFDTEAMHEEAAEQIIKLEDTLDSFGITAKVTHYERGPVLTRYEVEPERGIRVNQVVRLADDLAMALAAVDVRVEAPIPGKSAIGIEVPNDSRVTVGLRSIIESRQFQEHQSKLAISLGRDIAGAPVVADIGTMPHLLIAGATGSGKSVCLHSLIVSLLMRATPDEVRMIMVDPKRVELAVYDGIPHLMAPVVHSVKQAADVLRKAIREMEKRYDKFALKGVVNLAEYNALAAMPKEHATDEFEALPNVVIIIDELADLMMQGRAEFEFSICRIAQLARATGIHLILATQRPSVKVVTGNIKANVPTRIALAVASQVDSRTILDGQGAERLIGRGDMLYAPLDASKPRRIQGAFVPREDIERIVEHLRGQGEPEFEIVPEVQEEEEGDFAGEMETSDELYSAAALYVSQEQEASVSMIQRRFRVGYARAGRLIDMMEQRGLVGPHEGSKPRQVLVTPAALDALINKKRQPEHDIIEETDSPEYPVDNADYDDTTFNDTEPFADNDEA